MKIQLNSQISIDLPKLVKSRLLLQANSGGGKSYAIRKILEESHGKIQQIVLDPEGEFHTLREKFDYLLIGKEGDIQPTLKTAGLLAHKLLELNVSAIIDLYEMAIHERKEFVKRFLESMINVPRKLWHNCLVIVDEAHVFCPQKEECVSAGVIKELTAKGRKRGFCAVLATQSIAKLDKDAAGECNNKLIGRASQDIHMKRAAYELGFTDKAQILSLRSLKPGEFYIFGPAISDEVQKIKIGQVKTTHPEVMGNQSAITEISPPTSAIKAILKKLMDLPREAEKRLATEQELRTEISRLRTELTKAKKEVPKPIIDQNLIQKRLTKELAEKTAPLTRQIKKYENLLSQIRKLAESKQPLNIMEKFKETNRELKKINLGLKKVEIEYKIPDKIHQDSENHELSGPEQRILNAIGWMKSIGIEEPEQVAVAFLAGYTYGGGAFNNPKGRLRSLGLVEYVPGGARASDLLFLK